MPAYDPEVEAAAYAELDHLTADYKAAETALDHARDALHEGIVRHLREQHAPPGKLAEHTPYDRNHVGRIRAAADVPLVRPPAPKPRKRTAGGKTSG